MERNEMQTWFAHAGYGMMIHWGLYSLLGGEYKGRRVSSYAEWIQSAMAIPNREYAALARAFVPLYYDPEGWVQLARDAGMQYLVFTAKHHDGFAMFRSRTDCFNVAEATPLGRDVVEDLAAACGKYGLKLGLYYSQELDWHHPHGGGYDNPAPSAGVSWDNSWDFQGKKDYSICFEEKIKPQVRELLTNYGPLCLLWFDVPHTITPAQSLELNRMIRHHQPQCLINSRIGNGAYDYVSLNDNEYPPAAPRGVEERDPNSLGGYKYSPFGLYEAPGTTNSSWGYKYYDQNWITPEAIAARRKHLNSIGVNYLLNVGPDGLGRIPSFAQESLLAAARLF